MIKALAQTFHAAMASMPRLARGYFAVLGCLGRHLSPHRRQQVMNSLNTVEWTGFSFPAREVHVAEGTRMMLHPHAGEFDFEAVLGGGLSYEAEVFRFLDGILDGYDAVIDIGANVGVFTVFMAKRLAGRGTVYAFDPSREVFGRLLENLKANALTNVAAFNCAIGQKSGFAMFTEPEGHLTNGSLVEAFARQFSTKVKRTAVTVLDAAELTSLVEDHPRVLIKIDTEGFEAVVLEALAPVLRARKPDLIIEVLSEFEEALNRVPVLTELGYRAASITPEGLVPCDRITAAKWRDCFLTSKA